MIEDMSENIQARLLRTGKSKVPSVNVQSEIRLALDDGYRTPQSQQLTSTNKFIFTEMISMKSLPVEVHLYTSSGLSHPTVELCDSFHPVL